MEADGGEQGARGVPAGNGRGGGGGRAHLEGAAVGGAAEGEGTVVEGGEGGDGLERVGEHRRVVGAEAERQRPHQRRELRPGEPRHLEGGGGG